MKGDSRLRQWYDRYRAKYFGGRLPPSSEMDINFLPIPKRHGMDAYCLHDECGKVIVIDVDLRGRDRIVKMCLLHEMVHIALPEHLSHGKAFKAEMRRLVNEGAMDNLW